MDDLGWYPTIFRNIHININTNRPTPTYLPFSIHTCGWLFEYRLDDLRLRDGRRPVGEAGAAFGASATGTSGEVTQPETRIEKMT